MDVYSHLEKVRTGKPLVHHITNWVTIYDCAQIVKSFGASPVMAHAVNEAVDMTSIASALVLNIGTLTDDVIEAMLIAGKAANAKGIPVILDVCGAGATSYRDQMCSKLIEKIKISVIKGNASEICKVAGQNVRTKGVDSGNATDSINELSEIAKSLSQSKKCVTVITGKADIITDGKKVYTVSNGTSMMAHVVGTGCMAASVIGTFAAVGGDIAEAAVCGLVCYEIAAEIAVQSAKGPLDFKNILLDTIFALDKNDLEGREKISTAG
jgi:hydroxyethylthiazole kinase